MVRFKELEGMNQTTHFMVGIAMVYKALKGRDLVPKQTLVLVFTQREAIDGIQLNSARHLHSPSAVCGLIFGTIESRSAAPTSSPERDYKHV